MKRNIGILFPSSKNGGVYQYALSIADSLINYCDDFDYTIFYQGEKPDLFFNGKNIKPNYSIFTPTHLSPLGKIFQFFNN